jgi:N-methylhydantoinase B
MSGGVGTPTKVDSITLAVISGVLTSTVRQMTLTMERTARSPIFKLAHDYSNAVFDWVPRMTVQGADLPIHLGSLMHATKTVASYFGDDVHPGDVFYHNDPASGGSHYQDMCMFKPVFYDDEIVFWAANKAHMDDTGGDVAGGYNPLAEEIYSEGLRITPLRIHDRGVPRRDVIDLIVMNVRTQAQQRNDMGAQLAALQIAERNLLALVNRYGRETVRAAVDRILDIGEQNMRRAIAAMPDGVYEGSSPVEDDGRSGEMEIRCRLEIADDEMYVSISSPPQARSYINSYWANTLSSIYYGILTYAAIPLPYNEGLYRPIHADVGEAGSLTNATFPGPCSASTTTAGDNVTDAVRNALSQAAPERSVAAWAHCAGTNQVGTDPRTGDFYTFNMIIGTGGGGGATFGLDGWHCLNTTAGGGGILTGDVELLEHEYPVTIWRYELRTDSAGAGRWRGGLAPVFAEAPDHHNASLVLWGEGFKYPAPGVLGAPSQFSESKVARKYLIADSKVTELPWHGVVPIASGQALRTCPPGGGGVGDPLDRDVEAVADDVRNEFVSAEAARSEYGVIIDARTLEVDATATKQLRGKLRRRAPA